MNISWCPAEDGKRAHLCLCLAVLMAVASIASADAAESDRVAALAAGVAFLLGVGSCLRLLRLDVKGGVNLDHFGGAKVDQLVKG